MDNNTHLPEVLSRGADSKTVRTPAPEDLKREDLRRWKVRSLEQVEEVLLRYKILDIPKPQAEVFMEQLVQARNSWFIEAGDVGFIYLTNVIPEYNADLNVVFWDKKLSANRREAVKSVLATAFDLFQLPRISAVCAASNDPMRNMLRKVGFTLEGTIRRGWPSEPREDAILHGMLKEELSWHVLPLPESSLA
jgi:hypothetical protein